MDLVVRQFGCARRRNGARVYAWKTTSLEKGENVASASVVFIGKIRDPGYPTIALMRLFSGVRTFKMLVPNGLPCVTSAGLAQKKKPPTSQ